MDVSWVWIRNGAWSLHPVHPHIRNDTNSTSLGGLHSWRRPRLLHCRRHHLHLRLHRRHRHRRHLGWRLRLLRRRRYSLLVTRYSFKGPLGQTHTRTLRGSDTREAHSNESQNHQPPRGWWGGRGRGVEEGFTMRPRDRIGAGQAVRRSIERAARELAEVLMGAGSPRRPREGERPVKQLSFYL